MKHHKVPRYLSLLPAMNDKVRVLVTNNIKTYLLYL